MTFEKFFRLISYAAVFCGFFSLWVSGTFGAIGSGLFLAVTIAAWFLEDRRWQISEKLGTAFIVLALPGSYFLWRLQFFGFANAAGVLPGALARMILVLTAIKLLQKKSDRDWIFLYLMAFFEVLLAAGLSISALYLASFIAYLLVMVCAVIAFEIRKTARSTAKRLERDHKKITPDGEGLSAVPIRRLPAAAVTLIIFILLLGLPLFFVLPRVGGAGLGSNQDGVATSSGFSDLVRLGGIGRIQQNDAVVMRVRLENNDASRGDTHWRGLALDTFDNQAWSKSKKVAKQPYPKDERDLIQLDFASGRDNLTTQTVYLEPLDTPILFGFTRMVAVQGNFSMLFRDTDGAVSFPRTGERISYKVISDRSLPGAERLRADNDPYSTEMSNYLQLPDSYDRRIANLAAEITTGYNDRFSKAKAMESYLQNNFGYTLEMKAGGNEPLADFLFNVKEGHCEYFATAMAVMLRTQNIATRIVNGFQQGEYNDTADVWVVRQRHAHSWVEVYFPKEKVWVPFDPTPFAGQSSGNASGGIMGRFNNYLEALETFWIQYFVAFDNQEQQSIVRSARKSFADYQMKTSGWLNAVQDKLAAWWAEVRGDRGLQTSMVAVAYAAGYLIAALIGVFAFVWLCRKVVKWKVWRSMWDRLFAKRHASIIEFYDRMQQVLAGKGFVREPHQTPLEFAFALGRPEAVQITEKYNEVRFGEKNLSRDEADEIERWLEHVKEDSTAETLRRRV